MPQAKCCSSRASYARHSFGLGARARRRASPLSQLATQIRDMAGDSNEGKSHQVDVKSEHHAAATTQAQLEAHDRAMQPTSSNGIHGQHGKSASQADSPTGEVSGALTIAFLKCDSLPDSLLEKGEGSPESPNVAIAIVLMSR